MVLRRVNIWNCRLNSAQPPSLYTGRASDLRRYCLGGLKGLLEIGDDIVDVLRTDRDTDEILLPEKSAERGSLHR